LDFARRWSDVFDAFSVHFDVVHSVQLLLDNLQS
jgi:hypothetical protein